MPRLQLVLATAAAAAFATSSALAQNAPPQPVTAKNFPRAETEVYFAKTVKDGGFGQFAHNRAPTPIDKQTVIRMNRDTLYSFGIFDLDAGPVTVTLPDTGKRFMSLLTIDQDHYNLPVVYAPGVHTFTREQIGTRYVGLAIRTLVDAGNPADVRAANAAQDQIQVRQAAKGRFEIQNWDPKSHKLVRDALLVLAANSGAGDEPAFGAKDKVDPIQHLLVTAAGWGGNPREATVYEFGAPKAADGKKVHRLTVRDVPVDGFWSVSIYNAKGFFEKNALGSYSLNNMTAKPNTDGSTTLQFGGCTPATTNCLVTPPGWNYVVRLYRPRPEVLSGSWKFPPPQPAP
jgi:hypothetical protein